MSPRRAELLDAAAQVVAEKGIANTTVRDIGERAGILSGSLYHHFSSKSQLVAEALERGLLQAEQRDAAIIAEAADPPTALRNLIVRFIRWAHEEPDVSRILAQDQNLIARSPELAPVHRVQNELWKLWTGVVQAGIGDGSFRAEADPVVAVSAIFDSLLGAVRWLPPQGQRDPARIGAELAELYVAGLLAGHAHRRP